MQRGEMNADPVADEFFATEALGIADGLVRESLQNSLDARLDPHSPVRIRIDLSHIENGLSPEIAAKYSTNLEAHLTASGEINGSMLSTGMPFIAIEDFNTKGLTGNPEQDADVGAVNADRNNFYYFWRNVGRSSKGEDDRGRWGLGKTVFPAASRIRSFFGITTRYDDQECLLMGQCVLRIHSHLGSRYSPYGYFGIDEQGFVLPSDHKAFNQAFLEDFQLQRSDRPGLSVIVPYPLLDLAQADFALCIIQHYFFPILMKDLEVNIVLQDGNLHLDSTSIGSAVEQFDVSRRSSFLNLFSLAQWTTEHMTFSSISVESPSNRSPQLPDPLLPPDVLAQARADFENGKRLAFKVMVPIWVDNQAHQSEFKIFLEHDASCPAGEAHFIRQGLTISEVGKKFAAPFTRAIVLVERGILASLLGDAENPAHTDWYQRNVNARLTRKYKYAPSIIGLVKNTLRQIAQKISRPPEGRDENLLTDIFYIRSSTNAAVPGRSPRPVNDFGEGTGGEDDGFDPPEAKKQPFVVSQLVGGFQVKSKTDAELPAEIKVEVAYETRRGNALKNYGTFDFELNDSPIQIESNNAEIILCKENQLSIRPIAAPYNVIVTGFDERRNLKVRATKAKGRGEE